MKSLLIGIGLFCQIVLSQERKFETYNYGHNSIELISKSKKGTILVSTYNAKMSIRKEIAEKIFALYNENKLETDKTITIAGNEADVIGNCVIQKKGTLISIEFFYEKVNWKTGLTELYVNPKTPITSTSLAESE